MSNLYLASFFTSCFLFWWLPPLYYRLILRRADPISWWSIQTSVIAALSYMVGYFFLALHVNTKTVPAKITNGCEWLSGKLTKLLFFPAFVYAIYFLVLHLHESYGDLTIPFAAQGLLYTHIFFGFMYLSSIRTERHRRGEILFAIACILLPRIIIALHYGRAFIAFGVLPIVFISIAREWIKIKFKKVVSLFLLGICIITVPAILRGDLKSQFEGVGSENAKGFFGGWILSGSSLVVFDRFYTANLSGACSPILVSLTEQIFPYRTLGMCIVPHGKETSVANSAGIATYMVNGDSFSHAGTGSIYILDLYWAGGIIGVITGSMLMGFTCRVFLNLIARRSIFSGIWAECIARSLFSPRGTYGYMYQRIPSLLVATFLCMLIVRAALNHRSS